MLQYDCLLFIVVMFWMSAAWTLLFLFYHLLQVLLSTQNSFLGSMRCAPYPGFSLIVLMFSYLLTTRNLMHWSPTFASITWSITCKTMDSKIILSFYMFYCYYWILCADCHNCQFQLLMLHAWLYWNFGGDFIYCSFVQVGYSDPLAIWNNICLNYGLSHLDFTIYLRDVQ